ncbi:MAG TPA: glycosyltransferase [Pseudolabrys sp.]|nr:glycosyltransferase [Pseudolabrys sp.]
MLTAIIHTHESERTLIPTLAALVPGSTAGIVAEVIIADGGSRDATAEIAEEAGCRLMVSTGSVGARLGEAAAAARSPWLLFLRPGSVPDVTWVTEVARFVEQTQLAGKAETLAAVFRQAPAPGSARPVLIEALALLASALGARPRPQQGLLIAKSFYRSLGGHPVIENPEAGFLRRVGRRRLTLLRSGIMGLD